MYRITAQFPYKRAFITGAASGLGRALCYELAKDRWTIGICDIDPNGLQQTADTIEQLGGKPIIFDLDVADAPDYELVAKEFLQKTGGIDLLVNNAGIAGYSGNMEDCPITDWQWIVNINLMGVVHGCHYFIPTMKQQGFGYILNIASAAGFANAPNMSGYNVTKAGVISLSETLFNELKPFGIDVSVTMTTFFQTNIMQHSKGHPDRIKRGHQLIKESNIKAKTMAQLMLKACGNKQFAQIYPFQSRFLFNLKRFTPGLFRWLVGKVAGRVLD
ncbi:MAG TPA: SDR family NAD(P)-dependent oxidoreductase [Chitinophagales bacterium]|nr:SDR family NAD(P)-dependent oxidoreductase [Chitinophagales bacterium]